MENRIFRVGGPLPMGVSLFSFFSGIESASR
jgi:hypothetical protein